MNEGATCRTHAPWPGPGFRLRVFIHDFGDTSLSWKERLVSALVHGWIETDSFSHEDTIDECRHPRVGILGF